MSMLKSFDPKTVTLNVAGITFSGFGDNMLTIDRANGVTTTTVGVKGDISVNVDARYNGTLSFTLLHNAPDNDVMYALVKSYELGQTPFFPVFMEDPSGATISTTGWIETQPSYSIGAETGSLEWVVGLADARLFPSAEISIANLLSGVAKSALEGIF